MEENLSNRETPEQGRLCVCKGGPSLNILKDVQKAYEERIELINKVGGKNKLQKELELLRSWVGDLIEQNRLLARAVEEMETEISSRVMFERRRNSEAVCELRAEACALRRRLAHKDSDVCGLLEVLRRLRENDHGGIHDIRFYEVTERDIFGCTGQTDMENDDKQSDKRSDKQNQNRKEKKEFQHSDQQKIVCCKLQELRTANDTLQKEICIKDREIRKMSTDIQQYEQMVETLKNEVSVSRKYSTKDEEIMTEVFSSVPECACACACACGDSVPVQDCSGGDPAWEQTSNINLKMKSSSESVRAIRKQNVELKEEIRGTRQLYMALYEQHHSTALRLQFKDDIIREMRRQLRQAKAKLEMTKSLMPIPKTLSAEREDGSGAEAAQVQVQARCVRSQPRRRSRIDIEWECRSRSRDASSDETAALRAGPT